MKHNAVENDLLRLKEVRDKGVALFAWDEKLLKKLDNLKTELVRRFEDAINEINVNVEVFVGGSAAKKTFTKNFDLDLFIRFSKNYENISDLTEEIIKMITKDYQRLHASRDYFQFKYKGVKVEVVPVYNVSTIDEVQNITDASPFHVKWFLEHSNDEIAKDVVITKELLKANRLYGAETYRRGFSGYVCEILNVYYNGFVNLVRNASKWNLKNPIIIDIQGYYKDSPLNYLSQSKITPLIVIDPVDKTRNASAAISHENLKKFVSLMRNLFTTPSIDFFYKKPIKNLVKKGVLFKFKFEGEKEDIIATKIVKGFKRLKHFLNLHDFQVVDCIYDFDFDNSCGEFAFVCETVLDKVKIIQGPPIDATKNINSFLKKYDDVFISDHRYFAKTSRKFCRIKDAIEFYLKHNKLPVLELQYEVIEI